MSLAFKLVSLGVRTLAKPMGNYIKHQASEHEGFRSVCVAFAQRLHRIDMRMRLGLLQDPRIIERQVKREAEEAERKKNPAKKATAKTKDEVEEEEKEKDEIRKKLKKRRPIKPLSEAKAIDSGATFISEGFLFMVAGGLILLEQWRGKRKDNARRDEVTERFESLEAQLENLRLENQTLKGDDAQPHDRTAGTTKAPVHATPSGSAHTRPSVDAPAKPSPQGATHQPSTSQPVGAQQRASEQKKA